MKTPIRITRQRTKGWKMPPNTVCVDRSTKYGNPHRVGLCDVCGVEHTQHEAAAEFEAMLKEPTLLARHALTELRGKNLACWCKQGTPCHADTLLRIANE